jgi:uncharacterized membrane protein
MNRAENVDLFEEGRSSLAEAGRGHSRSVSVQRWGAAIGGGALTVYALARRSPVGAAVAAGGGALAYFTAQSRNRRREPLAHSTILVNCSLEEAYRFWHDFENLPRFMHHIESVTATGDKQSRWVSRGPFGRTIHWDAEIESDRENEFISWHSLPGSDINISGSVEFRKAAADRGTLVTVNIGLRSRSGAANGTIGGLFGKQPDFLLRQNLRRFKALVETGEIPTIEGQTHGPRGRAAAMARMADPDRVMRGKAKLRESFNAIRSAS